MSFNAQLARDFGIELSWFPDDINDEQLELARGLLRDGRVRRARSVLLCRPASAHPKDWRKPCRFFKSCSYCALRWGAGRAKELVNFAQAFANPSALLVTSPSATLEDLEPTLRAFKQSFAALRRRRVFVPCRAGVIAIECPLTSSRTRWNVHGHGIVDISDEESQEWESRVRAEWRRLRGQSSSVFSIEPLRSAGALSRYALKVGRDPSFCNPVLPPEIRRVIGRALRYKRLVIKWGK